MQQVSGGSEAQAQGYSKAGAHHHCSVHSVACYHKILGLVGSQTI